ncbi:Ldb17p [Rhodotorula paludigena]|uniref:Ldb17p n=1 Tax=Rhodotorula paludigena TaxID=86838 RepID=UPI00316BD0CF
MESEQEYHFSRPDQFWQELEDLLAVPPDSTLEQLDYALRNYIAFASTFMDQFLAAPGELDHALLALLSSPLFTSHVDRMIQNIISSISHPAASSSTLFISLMLVLHLGEGANPLTQAGVWADPRKPGAGVTVGSSKVFRLMRRRWKEVVPVLMKWVWDAGVVKEHHEADGSGAADKEVLMPAEGWEERVGTAATAVLYEMCRVQKLSQEELADFSFEFVSHLFALVERTRDVTDETFNYTLIKLIIALNEQFMVSTVPAQASGNGKLPPPILPTVMGQTKRERGPNTVLEVLREKEHESKTFGENIIFILNRADGTPDSLCVSLLILKILYLLFTTSGTQEYFYTNDLCVLVDVFIRELCNLGEESEGLKHTYLRVLHPLMTNTQLRQYPYKRPELRRVLENLIAVSFYRDCDPTTRRLVERNLRGSWCQGLRSAEAAALGQSVNGTGSTLSVDAVARAEDETGRRKHRHHHHHRRKSKRQASLDDSTVSYAAPSSSTCSPQVIAQGHAMLDPVGRSQLTGTAPGQVRASHDTAESLEPSSDIYPVPARYDLEPTDAPVSIASNSAGHDLLRPVAERSQHASASLAPPLIHPRPRSTSLSAAHYRSSTHGLGLSESPPPLPPSPLAQQDTGGGFSSASSAAGSGSGTYPPLTGSKHRRRAPPPPTEAGSRPRTPASCEPAAALQQLQPPPSPQVGSARRRPPPPPVSGRGSPRGGAAGRQTDEADEAFIRTRVEGLAVS